MIELEILKILVHNFSTYAFHSLVIPVAVISILFYLFGVVGIVQKSREKKSRRQNYLPKVTIQIPTFNEPVAIRCAEQCLKMDYPKNKFEIIIGDDSSNRDVARMIDDFAAKHKDRIKVTRRGNNSGFKAGNLNYMLNFSRGEVIVIFDSDFMPPADFLKRIVQPFSDPKIACVQSKWSYINMEQSPTSKFASTVLMVYHNILARLNKKFDCSLLFGSGEAVRKDVLVRLGKWQEGSVTEDVEFSVRALVKGYKTYYMNDLEVASEVPFNIRSLRTQQRRWAYGNMKSFIDHKRQIVFGKFSFMQKALMSFTMLGYMASFFLVAFIFFGSLSFITGEPSQINIPWMAKDIAINFVLSSGFTFAGVVALGKEKKLRHTIIVFFSALTIGILVSMSVCHGVLKAVRGAPMNWTIIKKKGNVEFFSYNLDKSPLKM